VTRENIETNARAEQNKALAALRAARALGELQLFDDAANRLYYAVFHLVSAALVLVGVQAHSQSGVASLLGQHLIRPGLLPASVNYGFALLLGLRGQADYNRHFQLDAAGFKEELQRTETLFDDCEAFFAAENMPLKRFDMKS
jgi:uncharacterized protein (UPF0332 family)